MILVRHAPPRPMVGVVLIGGALALVSGCTTRGLASANRVKRHAMEARVLPPVLAEEICTAMPEWFADRPTACRAIKAARIYHTSWWRPAHKVFGWVWLDEVHIRPDWGWALDDRAQLHLLVHELAHVVQHERDGAEKMIRNGLSGAGRRIAGVPNWHDTPFEVEAEKAAKEAMKQIDMDRVRQWIQ